MLSLVPTFQGFEGLFPASTNPAQPCLGKQTSSTNKEYFKEANQVPNPYTISNLGGHYPCNPSSASGRQSIETYNSSGRTIPVDPQLDTALPGMNEDYLQGTNQYLPAGDTNTTWKSNHMDQYSQPPASGSVLPSIDLFIPSSSTNTYNGHHKPGPSSVPRSTNVLDQIRQTTDDSNSGSGSITGSRASTAPSSEAPQRKRRPSRRAAASNQENESVEESGAGWFHKKGSERQWRKSETCI